MIKRLMCLFGFHDDETLKVTVEYMIVDRLDLFDEDKLQQAMKVKERDTFKFKCNNCQREIII